MLTTERQIINVSVQVFSGLMFGGERRRGGEERGRRGKEGEGERWREGYREHKPESYQISFSVAGKFEIKIVRKGPLVLGGYCKPSPIKIYFLNLK